MPNSISPEELQCRFTYHAPQEGQPERYEQLRAKAREFAELIIELTPESREQSLAVTKVEEATHWANASIARRDPHDHTRGFHPLSPVG